MEKNYYIDNRKKLLRDLNKFLALLRQEFIKRYGMEKKELLSREIVEEYDKLIEQFPYIGGKENGLTANLVQAGWGLALYNVLKRHGGSAEEAGELISLGISLKMKKIPVFLRRKIKKRLFSGRRLERMKKRARISQQRKYPEDWVWNVVEGDGRSFDIGIDYTECGIEKFMKSQGAAEFTPYLCHLDFVLFSALDMELIRTKNLSWGCDSCDFRFKFDGTPPEIWPPRFPEKECKKFNT